MAVGIHVAYTRFVGVDPVGNVIDKNDPTTRIKDVLVSEHQHRLIADSAIPNTATQPTVKAYLEAEAAAGYVLGYMNQTMIVTYLATQLNA